MHDRLSNTPCVIGVIATGLDKDVAAAWAEMEAWVKAYEAGAQFFPKTFPWNGLPEEFLKAVREFIMDFPEFTGPIAGIIVSDQNLDSSLCEDVDALAHRYGLRFARL